MASNETYQVISSTPIVVDDGGTAISYSSGQTFSASPRSTSVIRLLSVGQIVLLSGSGPALQPSPPGDASGWTDDGTIVRLTTAGDKVAIGAATMSGSEKVRIVGDTRIEGKLTVTGLIDPTGLYLDEQVADQPAVANKGVFYTKDVLGNTEAFYRASNGVVTQVTGGGGGGVTLDGAYDFGGAGSGRTVTVDSGAVVFNKSVVDATNAFEVNVTGGTGLAALFSGASISVPGAGASSERFGLSAIATGPSSLAIGNGAQALLSGAFVGQIAIGATSISQGDRTVAIGFGALAYNDESVAIGPDAWANNAQGGGGTEFPSLAVGDGCKAGPDPTATLVGNRLAHLVAIGDYSEAGIGIGANRNCVAIGETSTAGALAAADLQTYADNLAIGHSSRAGAVRGVFTIKTASALSGATFTVTVGGTPVTLTDGVDFTHSASNSTEATNLTNAINANGTLSAALTASRVTWFGGQYRIELKLKSTLLVGTTLTLATSASATDATAANPYGSADQIAIGDAAHAYGSSACMAFGLDVKAGTLSADADVMVFGHRATVGGTNAVVFGHGLSGGAGPAANLDSAYAFINNAFVAGSSDFPITDVWFGSGPGGSGSSGVAGSDYTIHAGDGRSGSTTGKSVRLAGGRGFAAGSNPGDTFLQVALTGAATTLVDVLGVLGGSGNVSIRDASNVVLGSTTGTQWGTVATQKQSWWGAAPVVQPTVTGSRGGNAALADLLTQLATVGLIVDGTSA